MKSRYASAGDIKVGVVGYGGAYNMGRLHLQDMQKAGMTPHAVVEPDAERLAVALREFPGIEPYASVEDLLKKSAVDLITIITPHHTHAPLALACLRAGRHVVVEKPFALTAADCDAMIAAAREAGALLSTFHNRHWDGSVLNALEVVRSGAIGEIVRVQLHMGQWSQPLSTWRGSKSKSGGILFDWGVHLLEYTLQLVPSEVVEVSGFSRTGFWAASSSWGADSIEDEATAVLRFRNGVLASLRITHLDANPPRGMVEVTGTKGALWWDYHAHEVVTADARGTVAARRSNPPARWEEYYANVATHLTRGEPLVITPEWARRPIQILDLAGRSAREGCALRASI